MHSRLNSQSLCTKLSPFQTYFTFIQLIGLLYQNIVIHHSTNKNKNNTAIKMFTYQYTKISSVINLCLYCKIVSSMTVARKAF